MTYEPALLSDKEIQEKMKHLPAWKWNKDKKSITRDYEMKHFESAVELIQQIAILAGKADHHPDLHLTSYRNLKVELTTHFLRGISMNDFLLAEKIEALPKSLKEK